VKTNQIAVSEPELVAVEFSPNSNMLLVITRSGDHSSGVAIWDFLDGHKDVLCRSQIPLRVTAGRWNEYLGTESSEFVTISDQKYHYWKIGGNLTLQYMEGDMPKKPFSSKEEAFTTCEFVVPTAEQLSIYILLGLNSGYVWIADSRCNQYLYNIKVLDGPIGQFYTSKSRIIVEGRQDQVLHCWPQGQGSFDRSDP
jgi:hypothetical protein